MPQLIFYLEDDYPCIHDLVTGRVTIGKSDGNDIWINDSSVSAFHAEVKKEDDGDYCLESLNPKNESSVNGKEVGERVPLKDGDKISLGAVKAVFRDRQEGSAPENSQNLKSLLRKTEIERNTLRLLENDSKWLRTEIKELNEEKKQLETKLNEVETAVKDASSRLEQIEDESKTLTEVIAETKAFKRDFEEWEEKLKERKLSCEKLSQKILKGEKLYEELDLENSIKEKKRLSEELEELTNHLKKSEVELEKNKRASEEAASIFDEAKKIEAGIGKMKADLSAKEEEHQNLTKRIEEGKKRLEELDLENSIKKKEDLNEELDLLTRQIQESKSEVDENRRAAKEAATIYDKAKKVEAEVETLQEDLTNRESERDELVKLIDERKKSFEEYGERIDLCKRDHESLLESLQAKQAEIDGLDKTISEKESEVQSSNERLTEVKGEIQKSMDEVSQSQGSRDLLKKESASLTRIIAGKSLVLQRLNERVKSGGRSQTSCPPLRLVNPGMSSLIQYFHHGAGVPDEQRFEPVGYPAFAACTRGSMHRDFDSISGGDEPILLMLSGDWESDQQLVGSISNALPERLLLVCWAEGSFLRLQLDQKEESEVSRFTNGISGIVSTDTQTTKALDQLELGIAKIGLPIPCPIEFGDWDLSVPITERTRGLFISGIGFDPSSSLHRARVELINRLVAETKTTVTLFQHESEMIEGLEISEDQLERCESSLKYSDYLRLVGQHFLVSGFGGNYGGGNVEADAVLARTEFIGADGENSVDQLLFPELCIWDSKTDQALETAVRILSDQNSYHEAMEHTQSLAVQLISFDTVQDCLSDFVQSIEG